MAKKEKNIKTNAMRYLDKEGITYITHEYEHGDEAVDAMTVAGLINKDPSLIYKTLVTEDGHGNYVVGVIPSMNHLDLKKLAKAANLKSLNMIKPSNLLEITGYIRGGCSPVGMKKKYLTFVQEDALKEDTIIISAGKIGHQIELSPENLRKACLCKFTDISMEEGKEE